MPVAALIAYVVFLGLAFGLRTAVHYRRTGRTGWVGISGHLGSAEWIGGVLFAVALVAGGAAPLAQACGWLTPWAWLDSSLAQGLGAVLYLSGMAGTLWSQFAMGDSWRIGVDATAATVMVASGPFRWVRNPIFSSMLLATAGLALVVPNLLSAIAALSLLVALELQVRRVEEPYLAATHGAAYRAYAARTGRFLPGLGLRR